MNHIIFRERAEALRKLGYTVQGKPGGGNTMLLSITHERPFFFYRTTFEQTPEQIVKYCRDNHMTGRKELLCPHPGEEGDLGFGFLDQEQFRELETLVDMRSKNRDLLKTITEQLEEDCRDIESRGRNLLARFEDYQVLGGHKNE